VDRQLSSVDARERTSLWPVSDVREAPDLQAQHAPAVLANDLQIAEQWGGPCLGYLLFFRPDPAATAALSAVQDGVQALEPTLLRQPEAAFHSLVAFLVPVFLDPGQPKDEIWHQHAAGWLDAMSRAAAALTARPIRLCFRRLIATSAAIIAVADLPNPITELRRELTAALDLPWPLTKGPLVHVTLFRYGQPLADPAGLLRHLQALDLAIEAEVSELLLVRETTFPSLAYEVLHRLPIGRPAA
jgi:hypothetical protein